MEVKRTKLESRVLLVQRMFNAVACEDGRLAKEAIVKDYYKRFPAMVKDFDFCFEVLAGMHKVGYTYGNVYTCDDPGLWELLDQDTTIRKFYIDILKTNSNGYWITPPNLRTFFELLVNRKYKIGYTNKAYQVKSYSPMLCKKYPEFVFNEGVYYVQEKLDGNRCIAFYQEDKWVFMSRSGKPLKVDFDMSWADTAYTFDGEIMSLHNLNSEGFTSASGSINSKYGDKSHLVYVIYDIILEDTVYELRKRILDDYARNITCRNYGDWRLWPFVGGNVAILPCLDCVTIYPNPDYNHYLHQWLDRITKRGGEGIIVRNPMGVYEHKRSSHLIKVKKTQSMDLRIVGWNEGKGKYAGMIGSFVCQTDDQEIVVSVAGITDEMRASNPNQWMGKIVEVAYFSVSQAKGTTTKSLRFPRFVRVRDDKDDTSKY